MENPIKIDDLGVPLTILETLTCFIRFSSVNSVVRSEQIFGSTYSHLNQQFHEVGPTCVTYESSSKAEEHHHNTLEKWAGREAYTQITGY